MFEQLEAAYPLKTRLIYGLIFFLIIGMVDVVRNPRNPKRAKEYLFIASVAFIASVYGVFRDYITFSISREYFVIAQDLGTEISFNPDIVVHAIRSTYWVGILIGVVFSFTNNPNQNYYQLSYGRLYRKLIYPSGMAIVCGLIASLLSLKLPEYFSLGGEDLLIDAESFEMAAYINWGTYLGVLSGVLMSIYAIRRERVESGEITSKDLAELRQKI